MAIGKDSKKKEGQDTSEETRENTEQGQAEGDTEKENKGRKGEQAHA